eukprot:TRINITY_DN104673_c0_g1_i1.p1 TRINITY_DN104673_c0_g1~~TRINITY_DN104673_c0_g1_i1.p1  ORF type:complete len:103 (+),score=4.11 TRINITY_DN104673_c0_g1_i1:40-348(+)
MKSPWMVQLAVSRSRKHASTRHLQMKEAAQKLAPSLAKHGHERSSTVGCSHFGDRPFVFVQKFSRQLPVICLVTFSFTGAVVKGCISSPEIHAALALSMFSL